MTTNYKKTISSFGIQGYRSFGPTPQFFPKLAQINLFIGQNNCGKSNVLHVVNRLLPNVPRKNAKLDTLDYHLPEAVHGVYIESDYQERNQKQIDEVNARKQARRNFTNDDNEKLQGYYALKSILDAAADGDGKLWFCFSHKGELIVPQFAGDILPVHLMEPILNIFPRVSFQRHESFQSKISKIWPHLSPESKEAYSAIFVPAIRAVGKSGSSPEGFGGDGIIERLAELESPNILKQSLRDKFDAINQFLREVVDSDGATITVPYERNTIHVRMNDKILPIESLGSGIHEVIILAVACTLHDETVICLEEPELHLNPLLQKKLIRYLQKSTTNQYFITTHSAAFMDVKDAEIYHVRLEDGQSKVRHITADQHRAQVCWDLGYHPSDLLQTNSIIWVEGPSDRIYLNWWLSKKAPNLLEGVHFSIMFYGGQLSHHITGGDETELLEDFISLSRMNRNSAILMDSDRSSLRALLKPNTKRLKESFEEHQRFCWVTKGREVENYVPAEQIEDALKKIHSGSAIVSSLGVYDNCLTIKAKGGKSKEVQASKVKVAQYIVKEYEPDFSILDLGIKLDALVKFIRAANPKTSVESFKN